MSPEELQRETERRRGLPILLFDLNGERQHLCGLRWLLALILCAVVKRDLTLVSFPASRCRHADQPHGQALLGWAE